ncbi:MAG: NADP-dependent isocitrate dehydrogenase [Bacteroidota bacterium]
MSLNTIANPIETLSSTALPTRVTIAEGDGVGKEIMQATLEILNATGVKLIYDKIKVGKEVYLGGHSSGISPEAWDTLRQNKAFLKGPIMTPQRGGYKSLNVTIRKSLGLYANVRPCRAYTPYVHSHFPNMNLVVIRENEEDLYAGIEHQQTPEVVQCLKLVSRPGCERIVRYAFEYARLNGRNKVTCMTKDNIMKHTDGLFHSVFREVATAYPEIEADHYIIDIGSAHLATDPERFDVIVTLNLYGDIISDITAQLGGSVGLGGSANIGDQVAMFEAVHGSAPDIAGQDIANPSGLIHAACMMLEYIGQPKVAARIMNALLRTIEDGVHTPDIAGEEYTLLRVGTQGFARAVIERLGKEPRRMKTIEVGEVTEPIRIELKPAAPVSKELVGVDIFIDWNEAERNPDALGEQLEEIAGQNLKLKMITNRGVKVYPNGLPETFCTDHWRCRFVSKDYQPKAKGSIAHVAYSQILTLMERLHQSGLNFIKTENLYEINGKRAYSLGQGE